MDCHEHEKINEIVSKVMYTRAVFMVHEILERKMANISCFKGHVRKGCVMECRVNGEVVQKTEIAKMIWKVKTLFFCVVFNVNGEVQKTEIAACCVFLFCLFALHFVSCQ